MQKVCLSDVEINHTVPLHGGSSSGNSISILTRVILPNGDDSTRFDQRLCAVKMKVFLNRYQLHPNITETLFT